MFTDEKDAGREPTDVSERSLARLLKLSGERGLPSPEATARAHSAAFEDWQSALRKERSRRHGRLFSLAAAVTLVAIGALTWILLVDDAASSVTAQVATVWGKPSLVDSDARTSTLLAGQKIPEKSLVHTETGRVALSVGDSLSLRANVDSRLRFDAPNEVTLLAGTVYVDSGGLNAGSDLRIQTPAGEVQHQGTQYLVSVSGATTQVRVREGRVQLSNRRETIDVAAGEEIVVADNGTASRRATATFGPDWEWASAMATPIDIDNRPLTEFLAWMVREHGWQLRYASAAEERAAQSIRLHGAAQGKTPRETLQRVSLITELTMRVENGVLVVGPRTEGAQ